MPGIGAAMLTSGRARSSARRDRPMTMPMATPATAASAKPANSRRTVSNAWCGSAPETVRRTKAEATVSSDGNKRGGKICRRATISHTPPTTRNGNAVCAAARERCACADHDPAWTARAIAEPTPCIADQMLRHTPTRKRTDLSVASSQADCTRAAQSVFLKRACSNEIRGDSALAPAQTGHRLSHKCQIGKAF